MNDTNDTNGFMDSQEETQGTSQELTAEQEAKSDRVMAGLANVISKHTSKTASAEQVFETVGSEEVETTDSETETEVPMVAATTATPATTTPADWNGAKVKELMQRMNLKQVPFAKHLGVSQGLISQVIKETTPVSKKLVRMMNEKCAEYLS